MSIVFRSQTKKFSALLEKEIDKAITESALSMAGIIKARTPVRTGRLRASITAASHLLDSSVKSGEGDVGTNVEYAPYVEYGTKKQKPQPYMRKGAEEALPTVNRIFKNRLSRIHIDSEVTNHVN